MEDGITGVVEPNRMVREEQVVIDIEESVAAMRRLLQEQRDRRNQRTSTGVDNSNSLICIYKVPQSLIEISPKAIEPEMVSIGPYHRGKDQLLKFESYKWESLERLLSRTQREGTGPDLRHLFEAAKQLEDKTRRCYDESISMSSQEFVEMMVLDGCFLIELFRRMAAAKMTSDPILAMPRWISTVTRDLLKLENQLPFFVLKRFFSLSSDPRDFLELSVLDFFNLSLPRPTEEDLIDGPSEFQDVKHLLDLFHSSSSTPLKRREPATTIFQYIRTEEGQRPFKIIMKNFFPSTLFVLGGMVSIAYFMGALIFSTLWSIYLFLKRSSHPFIPDLEYRPSSESIQCTTKLRPSGIMFKPLRADSFLVIKFKDGVLQIPAITINDLTITVYVNCIALEQCNYQNSWVHLQCPAHEMVGQKGQMQGVCGAGDEFKGLKDGTCPDTTCPEHGRISPLSYFTTYIAFMSCLINSSKDVAFLSADGIITSSFSHNDHDVAALFNKLGEKVYFHKKDCYLSQQFRDIEAYYNSPWASLLRTYFSRPWSFISFFSALLLLVLSVGQTVLSILTYVHHKR